MLSKSHRIQEENGQEFLGNQELMIDHCMASLSCILFKCGCNMMLSLINPEIYESL